MQITFKMILEVKKKTSKEVLDVKNIKAILCN